MMFNHKGLELLTHFLKQYPRSDSVHHYLKDDTLGFEEVWLHLKAVFDVPIHARREITQRTDTLIQYDGVPTGLKNTLQTATDSNYHICGKSPQQCPNFQATNFHVKLKACINISFDQMLLANLPIPFDPTERGLEFTNTTADGQHRIYSYKTDGETKRYLLPKGSDKLLTDEILFFYSRHSSYEECRHFVSLFSVDDVYPIVEDADSWHHGFQMKRHFGDLCNGAEFLYDQRCQAVYGEPEHVPREQPWIQNNLKRKMDVDFQKSVERITSSKELSFKGQASMKNITQDMDRRYQSLWRKGQILQGIHQYKVQKTIRDKGPRWLNDREREKNGELDLEAYTDDSVADDCDMARAMSHFNHEMASKLASRTSSVGKGVSFTNSLILSSFEQTDVSGVDMFKRLLQSSPQKLQQGAKRTEVNSENVLRFEQLVKADDNYGFFGVHLEVLEKQ